MVVPSLCDMCLVSLVLSKRAMSVLEWELTWQRIPVDLRHVFRRSPEREGWWVINAGLMSGVSLIHEEYLISGAVEALKRGNEKMADVLVTRYSGNQRNREISRRYSRNTNTLDAADRPQELKSWIKEGSVVRRAVLAGRLEKAREYALSLGEETTDNFLLAYARMGDLRSFIDIFRNSSYYPYSRDMDADLGCIMLRKAVASGSQEMADLVYQILPTIRYEVRDWTSKALEKGHVSLVPWCISKNSSLVSYRSLYKAVVRGHVEALDIYLGSILSISARATVLRHAIAVRDHELITHWWHPCLLVTDIIVTLVHIWLSPWLARALASYHSVPLPTFKTTQEEDLWIAPLLTPFLTPLIARLLTEAKGPTFGSLLRLKNRVNPHGTPMKRDDIATEDS